MFWLLLAHLADVLCGWYHAGPFKAIDAYIKSKPEKTENETQKKRKIIKNTSLQELTENSNKITEDDDEEEKKGVE